MSEDSDQQRLLQRFGRRFYPGEVIFSEGEDAREAFLLQEGRVRLIKRVGGVDRSLRMLRPGDLLGESALMPDSFRSSTAVAVDSGIALALDRATFQQVLASNPAVGTRVMEQLIRRLRDAEDQIEILMVRDGQAKVAVALLKLCRQVVGANGLPDGPVSLTISPMELAMQVGLDVDSVKRNVTELREAGHLEIVEERIEVEDLRTLQELVDLLGIKQHLAGTVLPGNAAPE